MSLTVFCTATSSQTEVIIRNLEAASFTPNDISVLVADKRGTRDFALVHNTKAPEGAVTGAGTGLAVGGALGWLAGIGALAIPGLGLFIAAGPILAALSGAAIGGTLGGIAGALVGLGLPELEARQFEGKVKTGSYLISIHTENRSETELAKNICYSAGVTDVTTASEDAVPVSNETRASQN